MTDHHKVTQRTRAVVVTPRDGSPSFLIVEIEVDCQVCGGFTAELAGHHLRALSEALGQVVAENPELCGEPMQHEQRTQWQGTAPGPGKARLN